MWRHLFLMVCEIAHAPRKIHDTNWRRYIRFRNHEPMMRLLWSGRPKVFVAGHFGNFELAGYTMGLFGFPTYAVARPLDNKYLDRFVKQFREAKGQHILPKQGSADEIAELLANNRTLSVLGDQHAGPKGCWVDFFGTAASTHKAIALFALSNNAHLTVGYARRLDRPLHYEMGLEALSVPEESSAERRGLVELTQWFTTVLEEMICRHPEQYWWLHRRWKGAPPKRVKAAKAA
jgi:KDO2-lipid IV(A) lauroyltransferase